MKKRRGGKIICRFFFAYYKKSLYLCRDISPKNELKITNYEKITMCGCAVGSLSHEFTGSA